MHVAKTAQLTALAVLTALLFTGCAAAEPTAKDTPAPSATVEETPETLSPEEAFIEEIATGELGVKVVEVIDPRTFVVAPSSTGTKNAGFSGEVTVSIKPGAALVTPAQGECGYDETLAFGKQYFSEHSDKGYVITGDFTSIEYYQEAIRAGFAYVANAQGPLEVPQADAISLKSGLWTTCPGFGVS